MSKSCNWVWQEYDKCYKEKSFHQRPEVICCPRDKLEQAWSFWLSSSFHDSSFGFLSESHNQRGEQICYLFDAKADKIQINGSKRITILQFHVNIKKCFALSVGWGIEVKHVKYPLEYVPTVISISSNGIISAFREKINEKRFNVRTSELNERQK